MNLEKARKRMTKSHNAQPVTAAGGIVFKEEAPSEFQILMILRNNLWDLPKGKFEPPETIAECAVREVEEEVGCNKPEIVQKVGTTYHEYEEAGTLMGKTTHWYSMRPTGEENFSPQQEEGIEQIRWFPFSKAVEVAGFDNLKDILQRFGKQQKKV